MTTTADRAILEMFAAVDYHGSLTAEHGRWEYLEDCCCVEPDCWGHVLIQRPHPGATHGKRLDHVHRTHFTIVKEG